MKRIILCFFIIFFCFPQIFSRQGFFLQNRTGVLIRVDLENAKPKYPNKKGPNQSEIPIKIQKEEFEKEFLNTITDDKDKEFVLSFYHLNEAEDLYTMTYELPFKIPEKFVKKNVLLNISSKYKKDFLNNYKFNNKEKFYYQTKPIEDSETKENISILLLRLVFLEYNRKNEMPTDFVNETSPAPHRFVRVFNPKTKANFDLHISWGVKFENNLSLGFAVMFTNFVMPSLELMLKYNFIVNDQIEPFVGGVIYGGFMDGFPVGINVIGGVDLFAFGTNIESIQNYYNSIEARLGAVLYSSVYFDTGDNSEGIWKKFAILLDGALYFNTGYIWE